MDHSTVCCEELQAFYRQSCLNLPDLGTVIYSSAVDVTLVHACSVTIDMFLSVQPKDVDRIPREVKVTQVLDLCISWIIKSSKGGLSQQVRRV